MTSSVDLDILQPAARLSASVSEAQSRASGGTSFSPGDTNQDLLSQSRAYRETDVWSRKIILSLDGGGVRGYSSLIILKRLMYLIEQIELGYIRGLEDDDNPFKYSSTQTSEGNLWGPESHSSSQAEEDEDILGNPEASVEKTLRSKVKNFKPHHYFDYIVGTSTGGLSAIMLGRLEKDVEFALKQYDTVGGMVFAQPRLSGTIATFFKANRLLGLFRTKYSEKKKKKAILRVIQNAIPQDRRSQMDEERLTLKRDEQRCKTFVVSYGSQNSALETATLFRSYEPPTLNPEAPQERREIIPANGPSDAPLWAAARATSAAPFYFKPLKLYGTEYCDGGIVANNPASLAYDEVIQSCEAQPLMIVTIGTGEPHPTENYANPAQLSKWHIFEVLGHLATQSRGTHTRLRNYLQTHYPGQVQYLRLNVVDTRLANMELDAWKPKRATNGQRGGQETKELITQLTKAYLMSADVNSNLLRYAKRLVAVRRERATSPEWELYACRTTYFCNHTDCRDQVHHGNYQTRQLLRVHAQERHGFIVRDESSEFVQCSVGRCFHQETRPLFHRDKPEEFREHLQIIHSITDPKFRRLEDFENWLNSCRKRS